MTKKYTLEQLIEAIRISRSLRQVMIHLNINSNGGGNYSTIQKYIRDYNIDTSHFTGQSWSKGRNFQPKRDINVYLSNQKFITSANLKRRLFKEGYFKQQCENCKLTTWLGNPIPLELHHKNGDNKNNNLCNLQILCPNCHSFTENFCSKNRKVKYS